MKDIGIIDILIVLICSACAILGAAIIVADAVLP